MIGLTAERNTESTRVPSVARLGHLFAPRAIAVIGASRDPAKLGAAMTRSLAHFPGVVVGINPGDPDPAAHRYRTVAEAVDAAGHPIDLAVLCVPARRSAAALTDAAAAGVRAALVCSGGYAEAGAAGAAHERDLLSAARSAAVTVLGPNTSGFIAPARGLTASFVPGARAVAAGAVAVVAASGGVNHALAFLLTEAGVGVSLAVGIGNGIDVTSAHVLHYLGNDPDTRAVALHVESVPNGPELIAAVRAISVRKPVIALVVGRNDVADFAQSHTGALATSWRTTRAALKHAGAVLVDDERQLVDAAAALSALRLSPAADPGVGVVTAQAGPGLLHVDGLRGAGVAVPPFAPATAEALRELLPPLTYQANPVDTGRPDGSFSSVLRRVAADPAVALTSIYALSEPDTLDLPAAVQSAGDGPFVVALGGPPEEIRRQRDVLHRAEVPVVASPSALTTAVRALVDDARGQHARTQRQAAAGKPVQHIDPKQLAGPVDEHHAKTLLGLLGVPSPPRRACADRDEARRALAALPRPVAVKILDADLTHKSDRGGVHLGIRDVAELDAALDALDRIGAHRYLVESMAPPGVDLLVGASRDAVFGPVVLLGLGGTVAEALADVAVAPAPVTTEEAGALAEELAGRALLDGFRGGPVADRHALGTVLAALGDLLVAAPQIDAVEINPLRVTDDGLLALDAVVTLRERSTTGQEHADA